MYTNWDKAIRKASTSKPELLDASDEDSAASCAELESDPDATHVLDRPLGTRCAPHSNSLLVATDDQPANREKGKARVAIIELSSASNTDSEIQVLDMDTAGHPSNGLSTPRIFHRSSDSGSDDEFFFTKLIAHEDAKKVAGGGPSLDPDGGPPNESDDHSHSGDRATDTMVKLGMFVDFVAVGPMTMTCHGSHQYPGLPEP